MTRYKQQVMSAVLLAAMLLAILLPGHSGSVHAATPVKAIKIAAGDNFSLALKSDGSVVGWGANNYLQLNVPLIAQSGVIDIAAGANHSLALLSTGRVVAWGANAFGQSLVPVQAESGVIAIAAGEAHSLALKADGSVIAWGWNNSEQTNIPAAAQSGVTAIAAGREHSLALNSGRVIAWGRNEDGEATVPAEALNGIVSLAATNWFSSVAVTSDGRVLFWGFDHSGIGTIPAAAQSGVASVNVGSSHVLAVKDGGVIAWGSSSSGKTSVPVAAQSGVIAVAAGDAHSLALKSDGTVVAWGNNLQGQSTVPGSANLSGLSLSSGVTTPSFNSAVAAYTHYVGATATSVDVTAALSAPTYGALLIDGIQQPSGTALTVPLTGDSMAISVQTEPYLFAGATYSVTVLRDTTPPSVSFGTDGNESWATSASTTVTVDDTESGLDNASLSYAWSASAEPPVAGWESFVNGDALTLEEADGEWYLHIRAQDRVGNTANQATARFRLDNTPPLVEVNMINADQNAYIDNTWTNQRITVSANATDNSGIASLEYSRDGGAAQPYASETPIAFDQEGTHTISFKASDNLGNIIDTATLTVNIDRIAPSISFGTDGNEGWATSVSSTVTVDDARSGVDNASLFYVWTQNADTPNTGWTVFDNGDTLTLNGEDGEWYLHIRAEDRAGNGANAATQRFLLGASAAELSALSISTGSLQPMFQSDITAYEVEVGSNVSSVTVTPAVAMRTDTVTVSINNGIPATVDSGQPSAPLPLIVGRNTITVRTTTLSGVQFSYRVIVTRKSKSSDGGGSTPQPSKSNVYPVGPEGKTISYDGGQLVVPQGALNASLYLTIDSLSDIGTSSLPDGKSLASRFIRFAADREAKLQDKITVSLVLQNRMPEQDSYQISLYWFNEETSEWTEMTDIVLDRDEGVISGKLDRFAPVAAAAGPTEAEEEPRSPQSDVYPNDIADHWAVAGIRQAVDKGIVASYPDGSFQPDRKVTRAEFVVMLARALKWSKQEYESDFADSMKIPAWARQAFAQAAEAGVVKGYSDGSVSPAAAITRAEMAVMVAAAIGLSDGGGKSTGFADDNALPVWAKASIAYLKRLRIVQGNGANEFMPQDNATRAEAVTVLLNMLAYRGQA